MSEYYDLNRDAMRRAQQQYETQDMTVEECIDSFDFCATCGNEIPENTGTNDGVISPRCYCSQECKDKWWSRREEMQHAIEEGEIEEGNLGEHPNRDASWEASKASSSNSNVSSREEKEEAL